MPPAVGLEGGGYTSTSAITGGSRFEAQERPQSSNNSDSQSALRNEALSSSVGDRSPNVGYSAMKASAQESSDPGIHAMLGGATIICLDQSSSWSPAKQAIGNFESQHPPGSGGGEGAMDTGRGVEVLQGGPATGEVPPGTGRGAEGLQGGPATGEVPPGTGRGVEGLQGGPDAGDVHLPVAGGADSSMEKAISLPSRGDVQTKPMSDLRDSLEQNRQVLESTVASNLPYLLENRVGVHGTDKKAMDGINNDRRAKGAENFCLATPATQPSDASDWIKQTGTALEVSDGYATNALKTTEGYIGVFRLPNEKAWAEPGLPYSDITCEKTKVGVDLESTGEIKTLLTNKNFDQMMLGWMDRSSWSDLEKPFSQPSTDDQADRNKIGAQFAKQAMIGALLNKLGVDVPVDKSVQLKLGM